MEGDPGYCCGIALVLYTCGTRDRYGSLGHPCGRACDALKKAGIGFEIKTVGGYGLLPWTRRGKRDAIRELSGQQSVPVLVLGDGSVVAGSGEIVRWAKTASASAAGG